MKNNKSKFDQHGRRMEGAALCFFTKFFRIKKIRQGDFEILFSHKNGKTFKVPLN